MAIINFEPTWISVFRDDERVRTSEPIETASSFYDDYSAASTIGFDGERILDFINHSETPATAYLSYEVINHTNTSIFVNRFTGSETEIINANVGISASRNLTRWGEVSLDDLTVSGTSMDFKDVIVAGYTGLGFRKTGTISSGINQYENISILLEGEWVINVPSNLSPSGGILQNVNEPVVFSWNHNGSFEQKTFELRYRLVGESEWNTISEEAPEQQYELASLDVGEYEWQVKTKTKYDYVSPWSQLSVFNVSETSPSPVFVNPTEGSTVEVSDLHVEWDSVDQHRYEFELRQNNNILWADARISTNQELAIDNILENGQSYQLRLRVNQEGNIFSPWVTVNINVDYTQPPSPISSITPNEAESCLRIFIDNPTPTGTEPQAVNQELFKREPGGDWIKLADLLPNSEYIDYAVASEQVYEYRVTVHGNNDTSTRSSVFRGSVKIDYTTLNLANEPGQFIKLKIVRDRSGGTNLNATKKQFAGRSYPVTEFGETLEDDIDIDCLVTPDEYQFLIDLFKRQETLIYRDSRGRKMYATVASFTFNDEYKQYVSISTSFNQVDYKEGID